MPNVNQTELEQTFSDIAYAHLRDKSNSLLDYLLGFQLLKSEDDGKRAVGIFGFEIGGKIYYAPVFFLNGEIRGLEGLYCTDTDLMLAMTDKTVNELVNRADVEIGRVTNEGRNERGVNEPNYRKFRTIPGGGSVKLGEAMSTFREDQASMSLPEAVRALGPSAQRGFYADLKKHARLREAVETYYNLMDFLPDVKVAAEQPKQEKKLLIIGNVGDAGVEQLTDEQRKDVLAGGVAVVDNRDAGEKSTLYTTEAGRDLITPNEAGVWEILMSDGGLRQMLVLPLAMHRRKTLIRDMKDGDWCVCDPSGCVWAVRQYNNGLREHLADAPAASSAKAGQTYSFASLDGDASIPYKVMAVNDSLDGSTTLSVRAVDCGDYPEISSVYMSTDNPYRNSRYEEANSVTRIIVTQDGTSKPLYYKDKLVVSDRSFRLVQLAKQEWQEDGRTSNRLDKAEFGDFNTVVAQLGKTASAVDAWQQGWDINICVNDEVHTFDKVGAYHFLLEDLGLDKAAADGLFEDLQWSATRYYVKAGAAQLRFEDPEDPTSGGEMSMYHDSVEPQSMTIVSDGQEGDNREAYEYQSPFGGGGSGEGGGQSTLDIIQSAISSGDKEVFDAAGLNALIQSYVPTDMVDRFIPSITVGMDRIGRILFLIYWHYSDFAKRYGEDEVSDLLDELRSVFERLGDMVIGLKKRTLAGDPEHFGLGLSPDSEAREE